MFGAEVGRDAPTPPVEKIDRTHAGDSLRLKLLAPALVEAIVEGRQSAEMTLPVLMEPFAVEWAGERRRHGVAVGRARRAARIRSSHRIFDIASVLATLTIS